jgi:hypothetical protein
MATRPTRAQHQDLGPRRALVMEETKHASKTTEFYAMIAVIVGILVAAWYVGRNDLADAFTAQQAWLYVSIVAAAYIISRGLAKSGSRKPVSRDDDDL